MRERFSEQERQSDGEEREYESGPGAKTRGAGGAERAASALM